MGLGVLEGKEVDDMGKRYTQFVADITTLVLRHSVFVRSDHVPEGQAETFYLSVDDIDALANEMSNLLDEGYDEEERQYFLAWFSTSRCCCKEDE